MLKNFKQSIYKTSKYHITIFSLSIGFETLNYEIINLIMLG